VSFLLFFARRRGSDPFLESHTTFTPGDTNMTKTFSEPPYRIAPRATDAHKGDFGRVVLIGGSRGMSGAIALSGMAALTCGSGLVTVAVPDRCLESVAAFHPGLMTWPLADDGNGQFGIQANIELHNISNRFDAIGCGPGMRTDRGSIRIVESLLALRASHGRSFRGIVLDADAINILAVLNWAQSATPSSVPLILTPHPGELQRLCDVSPVDRLAQIEAAQLLAKATQSVIVVKGGPTVVVSATERWTNITGNPGMATPGAGDVLTGVLVSLLGQAMTPWDAARLGVWIHGYAGDCAAQRVGQSAVTCTELISDLPAALRRVESTA
jgi:NAD(P)H-hydrate epimerase